jgi:mannose-1-phosphate guanylyltransferase
MLLCAGFGTRLRPLTDTVPKPLMPLCGVPLLRYNFALLKNAGVREIVINTHHLGKAMERGALDIARQLGIDLQISREEKQILGTGGGVRRAQKLLGKETFFLLNGDMIFDVDLPAALAAHRKAGAEATMVLAPYPRGATYAAVEVDARMNVRRIAGRGAPADPSLSKMHFTGVHVLEPELVARLPPEGESDINRIAYVRAMHDGAVVHGFLQEGYWGDLGAPRSFLRANLDVLERKVPLARFHPDADPFQGCAEQAPGVFVHSSAQVESPLRAPALIQAGATVAAGASVGPGVVIGTGASVDAGAQVERAVIWEGTHIAAGERVVDQIAAPRVRVDV